MPPAWRAHRRHGRHALRADDGLYDADAFSSLQHFNARSDDQSAFVGLFSNAWLWAAVALSLALQVAVVYVPFLQRAFGTVALSGGDWLFCFAVGSVVVWLREISKAAARALG